MGKYTAVLHLAQIEFEKKPNWMDFKNKFFGQGSPYIPETKEERKEYIASPEYAEIRRMAEILEEEQPEVEKPTYSGKFMARVGYTIHKALAEEANREGMPMNQLVIAKLAIPLYDMVKARK